jgi:hypothetical protein
LFKPPLGPDFLRKFSKLEDFKWLIYFRLFLSAGSLALLPTLSVILAGLFAGSTLDTEVLKPLITDLFFKLTDLSARISS